ncbi:MAG: ABC transporter permease [Anaerolineae bacterium]
MAVETASNSGVVSLTEERKAVKGESLYTKALKRLRRDKLTLAMLGVLTVLVLFSVSAPLLEQVLDVSYRRTNPNNTFQCPFWYDCERVSSRGEVLVDLPGHVLGTDDIGRDHLTRLAYAGQITLAIAFTSALLSLTIGVSVGIITGYYGGLVDDFMLWLITTLTSIPQLILLVIIAATLSPGPETLILVLGFLGWTGTARLVRGETLSLREREFVVSARALGASDLRIMARHIAPNLLSIVIVTLAIDIGALMLAEAALSFLGLGVKPPTPTWGNMLSGAQQFFTRGPFLVVFPGLLITVTVLCLYVIGDGVRDAFDPRVND